MPEKKPTIDEYGLAIDIDKVLAKKQKPVETVLALIGVFSRYRKIAELSRIAHIPYKRLYVWRDNGLPKNLTAVFRLLDAAGFDVSIKRKGDGSSEI